MKQPIPIAVTSRAFSRHPVLRAELLERYETVRFNDTGRLLAGDELAEFLRGHPKAIVSLEPVDEPLLERVPELELISKYGVGLDNLDLGAMERKGVKLGWKGGINRRSVSELVLLFALASLRHLVHGNAAIKAGRWEQKTGAQLSGRTVGIIGCGHIGKDLVTLLAPFGCPVLAHDIRDYSEFYAKHGVEAVSLPELLRRSDIVTLHVPHDESTHRILDDERLGLMKKTAVLINTARGNLVDEQALKRRLGTGRLAAAAFDVFAVEPPDDAELLALPNLLVTPHIGGSSEEAILAMGRQAIAGLEVAGPAGAFAEA